MTAPSWRESALCREMPDAVAPEDDGDGTFFARPSAAQAIRICRLCTVTTACLTAALHEEAGLDRADRYGIRGGLTPTERARIREVRAA